MLKYTLLRCKKEHIWHVIVKNSPDLPKSRLHLEQKRQFDNLS
ncbi:MAG: hypothetical protein JWP37_2497 [Mucilaginibacter sp.]|nr:hypothetical protein [Mucilaginibacter sp.]